MKPQKKQNNVDKIPPWRSYFVEIAVRALARVHLEHQAFGIGWKGKKPWLLNQGEGCLLALETTVTSAMSAEFNQSKLTYGWGTGRDNKKRYWVIEQEQHYKHPSHKQKRVDLVVCRVAAEGSQDKWPPALIEAKRAELIQRNIRTGKSKKSRPQISSIAKDVVRLADESRHRADKGDSCYAYLFVWGRGKPDGTTLDPASLLSQLKNHLRRESHAIVLKQREIRWIPLKWRGYRSKTGKTPSLTPSLFLWSTLIEITRPLKKNLRSGVPPRPARFGRRPR